MARLRLALTLPGAVALGAYEGGALAALLVGIRSVGPDDDWPIVVDAIASASAGSITGLLVAFALLEGADPVDLMREAWVERDSLHAMRTRKTDSPLAVEVLSKMALELMSPSMVGAPDVPRQPDDIHIQMAVGALRGLTYKIASLERATPVEASTYMDWSPTFVFHPNDPPDRYVRSQGGPPPIDFALASAANEFGFPPKILDRTQDLGVYEKNGILGFPDSHQLWYTDGGTIDNEPLGRTIDLANDLDPTGGPADEEGQRLHLLVSADSGSPPPNPADLAWADPTNKPSWIATLLQGDHIQRSQSVYDDLRRLEKTNSRITWTNDLQEVLLQGLTFLKDKAPTEYRRLTEELRSQLAQVEGQSLAFKEHEDSPGKAEPGPLPEGDAPELLKRFLRKATGLAGKHPVKIEVVTPALLPEAKTTPISQLLSGEFLLHFGGFLDRRLRMSDFVLGYRSMAEWIRTDLQQYVDPEVAARANQAVQKRMESEKQKRNDRGEQTNWADVNMGSASLRKLRLGEKWDLFRLGIHTVRVILHGLRKKTKLATKS